MAKKPEKNSGTKKTTRFVGETKMEKINKEALALIRSLK